MRTIDCSQWDEEEMCPQGWDNKEHVFIENRDGPGDVLTEIDALLRKRGLQFLVAEDGADLFVTIEKIGEAT